MRVTVTLDGIPLFDSGERDAMRDAVRAVATFYAGLTDDEQAQFFEHVGKIMADWRAPSYGADWQQAAIGEHMAACKCITAVGRDFLRRTADYMDAALKAKA